jgi:hypothetical protein
MQCTYTEKMLLVRQLRRARDEVVRAKLMLEAVATEEDDEAVDALANMADHLTARLASIRKAELMDDEDDDAEEN